MPRLSSRIRLGHLQLVAALVSAALAYKAFTGFKPFARDSNFDETAGWLGLALLSLAVVAWDGALPRPTTWPARMAAFLREHRWELALLLPVIGFAIFMWTFRFGEFPPSGFICCEEDIRATGGFEVVDGGDRPLLFPLPHYATAFGFLLFGENTLGLRFVHVLAGIVMVPVFYLLLRELVRVPAALFATALLASSWPLLIVANGGQTSYLATVLFAYLLVLGIRRRNALALLGAGLLAGVLSYEWALFKAVPVLAGGFLVALVAYRLAYPLPEGIRAFWERVWSLVKTNWRSLVTFVGAALIVVTPLLVTADLGRSTYFSGVDRSVSDRGGGLLVDEWEQQVEWAVELFLPFGSDTFQFGFMPKAPLVDPITGTLLAVGVILGIVTVGRPFRLLFLAWYLGSLAAVALLMERFQAHKLISVLPAGLVLVAFVADDVGRVLGRWARGPAIYLLPLSLLGGALFVAYWNADTYFGTASKEAGLLKLYEGNAGMQYALCDYLRGRGDENFSYTFNTFQPTLGFARPHELPQEQGRAWSSLRWVCQDLRGQALASPAEVWPLRDIPPEPLTFAFIVGSNEREELAASLGRAIPSKLEPDRIITGSQDVRNVVAYELTGQELKARQGLFAQYRSGEAGTLLEEGVDGAHRIVWDDRSGLSLPFTVQWRGLIYVPQARRAALTARTSDSALITVDGRVSYSSQDERPVSFPQDLLPGWHPIEILLSKETPGGSFALEWVGPEGLTSSVAREDLFALDSLEGWTHEREVVASIPLAPSRTQRFDFAPYISSAAVMELGVGRPEGPLVAVTGERWSAVWHVREGREYELKFEVASGAAEVKLDGATVLTIEGQDNARRAAQAVVSVDAGSHNLEIQQQYGGGAWTGAKFDILAPDDPDYAPEFSPY